MNRRSARRPRSHYAIFALLALVAAGATASGADTPPGLFDTHEPLAITLEGPFEELAKDSIAQPQYRDAVLRIDGVAIALRIRARGKSRRHPRACLFPPLRLNFAKDTVAATVFAGQDKLKMVTHCRGAFAYQQYVLREYLAYRLYNHITERSFRVRLLAVTYIDTSAGGDRLTRPAFLIEDSDRMAQRNDARVARLESITPPELDPEAANLFDIFQYMIGNTDWSATIGPVGEDCCHNAVLIIEQPGRYIPVPFDFDVAGIVNAPYALPSARLPIYNVTERIYRGFCRSDEIVNASVERFVAQRETMFALIDGQTGLSRKTASRLKRYLDRFFTTMEDAAKREHAIERNCR